MVKTRDILYCAFVAAVIVVSARAVLEYKKPGDADHDCSAVHFIAFLPAEKGLCPPCAAHRARTQKDEGFITCGTSTSLIGAEFIKDVNALDGVKKAAPFIKYRLRPDNGQPFTVGGFDLEDKTIVAATCCAETDIIDGRFLNTDDTNAVMLEQPFAEIANLKTRDTIDIIGKSFTIVGIVSPAYRLTRADVYMLRTDAQQIVSNNIGISMPDPINVMLVQVTDHAIKDRVIQLVKSMWTDLVISTGSCCPPAAKAMSIHRDGALILISVIALGAVLLSIKSRLRLPPSC